MKKNELIICECQCDEHQMIFKYDDDPNWENVYISYYLQSNGLWSRIKNGIKHIFGYKSKYGDFGEIILGADDETIEKFERVLNKLKDVQKLEKKRYCDTLKLD